jgi:hypothetical protein
VRRGIPRCVCRARQAPRPVAASLPNTGSLPCRRATATRRVGGEAPMPASRPVVSSPPPSEPDVRLPPPPALHEHNERSLARAADVGHGVPAALVQRRAGVHRRPPPVRIVPRAHWTPSPCGRLSRPPRWVVTPTTTTGPPPRPSDNGGRCACPEPTNAGSAGIAGTLPTFTHTPVGRVGAQLYPGDIAARHRNPARGLARPTSYRAGETALCENEDRASRQP